ncbi:MULTISPECIES: DNA repair ATPase [Deinococcus]|uniref:DNA repair ATPase n=1 Tax=Deinococcus rufus TaxID=2136097 RepID=A0ABV7ZEU6_9DEIO|nr:DNA repair ATPase [Deinococcus sp. AB2017081]WQE96811.1 DNA repair ATPase [Deinococcus sp. AB2017081]
MTEPTAPPAATPAPEAATDQAVAQGGAYEVLRRRLSALAERVQGVADDLNARRIAEFGRSGMTLAGRVRIRTEHNSVGRDIVGVGDMLCFGFNVFLGLKAQTRREDVFALHRLVEVDGGYDVQPVELAGSFLADPTFVRDFEELYAYYKDARLLQLTVQGGWLLAAFQIGARSSDMRVFRWSLPAAGGASYVDARGERELAPPAPFDFEWVRAGRELEVSGRHPHLNILDTLFVETSGGDLTVKIENNTETGQGIYAEPVEDTTQSLDDARFEYARVGSLILLRVLPYRETVWRGLVYNTVTRRVVRLDAITQACIQLPEDHGIIFPGGYYLQGGEHRAFDAAMQGMAFRRALRSPNGEDVLYEFYERESGRSALFVYNVIRRELGSPLFAHGCATLPDGRMVLFHAEGDEATRVHQMQVWHTPFVSDEFAAARPPAATFLGRVGNAELVRGVSDLYDLARSMAHPDVSAERYARLTAATRRLPETHHWFTAPDVGDLGGLLHEVTATGEAVLDEFEKVQAIRAASEAALAEVTAAQRSLLGRVQPEAWTRIQEFVDVLGELSALRGRLLTVRERRYVDTDAIDALTAAVQDAHARTGAATGAFLAGPRALAPLGEELSTVEARAGAAGTARELGAELEALGRLSGQLDTLSELLSSLPAEDATQRTAVVETISALYARVNGARARTEQRRRSLGSAEAVAGFAAQLGLYGQAVTGALALATTPERADEQLARLLVTLEELEGQFGEHEDFLPDILAKREETLELLGAHRQALLDDRQRRAQALADAAARILEGLGRRTERLGTPDELNAFFAGDPLILKLRDLAGRLRDLKDSVKADDLEARLTAARDQAVRAQRDRAELFEGGGAVIRLGPRHRFSVNTQPLDLTLLPRPDGLAVHLTGTEYLEPLRNPALDGQRALWGATVESESPEVPRAEYLAGELLRAAETGEGGLGVDALTRASADPAAWARTMREFAAPRYREGYETGIHDHDAALILRALLPLRRAAGPLVWPPRARALAALYWADPGADPGADHAAWAARIASAHAMRELFGHASALDDATADLGAAIAAHAGARGLPHTPADVHHAAASLVGELHAPQPVIGFTRAAAELRAALEARLDAAGQRDGFRAALAGLEGDPAGRWALVTHWLDALAATPEFAARARFVPEAAALLLCGDALRHEIRDVTLDARVEGLLSEHPRIVGGTLDMAVDDTLARLDVHRREFVPAFRAFHTARQDVIRHEREALRLDEFRARPLTSFVRNRLINDVYLPLIGDNLAKQMGTAGEGKRSDLMGLLMLISPPGYGKTTLMEYVANRLGLVFMKIGGPALGHGVRSLDPAQAPDATSRQELEKLNLALEMGNNVMLYVDDIQHTHPEFLQKFISLTDGTRRIEGVWRGGTKTYDLRGRKFAVVMAGNPYTESGEVFRVPDMLANRADIYNLGDVLGGVEDAFLLSYIENSLTSNPVLAPLATRDLNDVYTLVDRALGRDTTGRPLSHTYSAAEAAELIATLQRVIRVRDVLARVNAAYIASAAQADAYRTEPPFRLQGSYRNMTKLAEKVSPVMNDAELDQLITDHYRGEAQLLTTGAEENLLKLAELRGTLTPVEAERWAQIRADYLRHRRMGSADTDTGQRMVAQLADIASGLQGLGHAPAAPPPEALADALGHTLGPVLADLSGALHALAQARPEPTPLPPPPPAPPSDLPDALRASIEPLVASIAASAGRQDQVNAAILHLVDAILKRQTYLKTPTPPRPGVGRSED